MLLVRRRTGLTLRWSRHLGGLTAAGDGSGPYPVRGDHASSGIHAVEPTERSPLPARTRITTVASPRRVGVAQGKTMTSDTLLQRITWNAAIYSGKPIIRGRRLAVEHVLDMLAAGSTVEDLLAGYPWLEREDVQACLLFASRVVGGERIEPQAA